MKADVVTLEAGSGGQIDLDDAVFGASVRADVLHRVVTWQLARRQAGTHKTKRAGEVRGSTRKQFAQKGGGRARQGSGKVGHFRGGSTPMGPRVRSHAHDLPKKIRRLGLINALSAKLAEGNLVVIDQTDLEAPKTKDLKVKFDNLGWKSVLVIDGNEINDNFAKAISNIPMAHVLPSQGANVYDILRCEKLVLTKSAVEQLEGRLK